MSKTPRHSVPRTVFQPGDTTHLAQRAGLPPPDIYFRTAQMPANAIYPAHHHVGGEFVYSFQGIMELQVKGQHFWAPPQYGVWLPPGVEHVALNRLAAGHASLYLAPALCGALPATACAIRATPLMTALLDHLRELPHQDPPDERRLRLMHVLVDQLGAATPQGSYLPHSRDPLLAPVLQCLLARPQDNRTLADLAAMFHTTQRTLMRRCERDLGMSLTEWRQRLRILRALAMLERGRKVEHVAVSLGYANASSFIAMFRKLMKRTPAEFVKDRRPPPGL